MSYGDQFTFARALELIEAFPGPLTAGQSEHLVRIKRLQAAGLRDLEDRPARGSVAGPVTPTNLGRFA